MSLPIGADSHRLQGVRSVLKQEIDFGDDVIVVTSKFSRGLRHGYA